MHKLLDLARRVEEAEGPSNALDVLIEVAMFVPDADNVSCKANSAGTKVIYTDAAGHLWPCWAEEWTRHPAATIEELRARAALEQADER